MNREKKIKTDNLYITAIKNYLIEYEKQYGFQFSLYDHYDKKLIYKFLTLGIRYSIIVLESNQ